MHGYEIDPNLAMSNVPIKYSIPFSSQGCLYTNFGVAGVIIGGFLTGAIYHKVYSKLNTNKNGLWVLIYQLAVYEFEFTVLSIVQLLIPLIISVLVYYPAKFIRFKIK